MIVPFLVLEKIVIEDNLLLRAEYGRPEAWPEALATFRLSVQIFTSLRFSIAETKVPQSSKNW